MGEIRIVGPGKTGGYPYPVCKKIVCPPIREIIHLLKLMDIPPYTC